MLSKTLFPVFTNFASKTLLLNVLGAGCNRINRVPNLELVRYAARKGTREKALAKKRARKLQKLSQPDPIPKYLQRKVKVSPELQRVRCKDENWLIAQPIDNVYNMKLFRGKPNILAEAIQMHQETHRPAMLNDPSALVYANVEIDLRLKKKDRYLENLAGILTYPHEFTAARKNSIIVICKTPEDQVAAIEAGAENSGASALIKQILAGSISKEDFDFVICHPDMLKELNVIRGILGKKFPNTYNGLLRIDIAPAVKSLLNGAEYELKRSVVEYDFGWVDVPFGRLDMPLEHLEENLKVALDSVEKQKPSGVKHPFIIRTQIWCSKSREKFKIPHWNYLPNYPENGIEEEEVVEAAA